jgi:peptidoglycan/xylan/chitin deacetylase (PgdA/CDA1 family)
MTGKLLLAALFISTLITSPVAHAQRVESPSRQAARREVAVTFDDLPFVHVPSVEKQREMTRKLLGSVAAHNVPAVGFVNENKLLTEGARDEARVALLRMWTDAGIELGNHTF